MHISTGNSDLIFFLGVIPLFELRNLTKMKDTTQKQFVSTTPLQRSTELLCSYEGLNV